MSYVNLHEYSEIEEDNVYADNSKPKGVIAVKRNDSEQTEENQMKGAVELGLLHSVTEDPMNEIMQQMRKE